jgi:hypothetical protein
MTGKVTVVGNGESAVTAWYLSRIAVGTVSAPFPNTVAPEVFTKAERRNWIDDLVLEKLAALNLAPSPRCTDGEFLRRAFLDTCGILPTADEARAFLAETAPDKRDRPDRVTARAAGIRRFLEPQVERPAARFEQETPRAGDVGVLQIHPRQRRHEHAVG